MSSAPAPPEGTDVRALAEVAREVAEEAATMIVQRRPADLGVATTKSSLTDVVTVMDQASQDLLRSLLGERRPQDAFAGEEEGGSAGTSGLTWVVDPIDGTVNYLYGLAAYAVSVAVVVGDPSRPGAWRPVAGAVVDPVAGRTYVAALGEGATVSEGGGAPRPLRVAEAEGLGLALCATGFGYEADRRAWQGQVLARLLPQVRDIRRLGSAALDLCRVADGTVDVYYERGLNPWDLAAGWLVATEAGAAVTDLDGGGPSSAMTLAGAPRTQAALREALLEAVDAVGEEHDRS
ncbi:inositol monophosphatase family protein [Janibacter melonis]|uniref:inositol monophosphatase family protein n=1 Tax=Janibacter melonis TaxID=262209 RepID=UPI001786556D|nr:inositol monophosphatase [Janibacter melonis]